MKNIIPYTISVLISLAFIALPISSQADSIAFKGFYVFGDSLSDTGNVFILTGKVAPPSINYYQGRFSNGPVAFEYLWKALTGNYQAALKPSLGNVNYTTDKAVNSSYGGAKTQIVNRSPGGFPVPGLVGQVDQFINNVQSTNLQFANNNKTLYALWAGANDYLLPPDATIDIPNSDCPTINIPNPVVCNIADAITRLYSSVGARYFLVPNLPDLGSLPILNDSHFSGLLPTSAVLTNLTKAHNSALKSAIQQLEQTYPDIHIMYVDIYSTMNTLLQILPYGNQIGPAGDCLFLNPYTCTKPSKGFNALGYIFWDVEHPTTGVHGILAANMITAVLNTR
jgi:outer membrane lipase/esterase